LFGYQAGGQPLKNGGNLGCIVQTETADQDRTVLNDNGAQRLTVLDRPVCWVTDGLD
jgi:hypothetical protein